MPTHQFTFGTLELPPPHPACRLIATIPAKDEAGYITAMLEALYHQRDGDGQPVPHDTYEAIVLANNCGDETADICRNFARQHPNFRLHVAEKLLQEPLACVGTARRLMMDTALLRFRRLGRPTGVICTTDADTRVHHGWVHHTLKSVEEGAQAVGGRILVPASDREADSRYRKNHLLDVTYRSLQYCLESMIDPSTEDPWPRHFQHFGPSTALTAAAYERCGGIPPLKSLEDVNLIRALERVNISVTHDRNVKVYTSSRVSNRVEGTAFSHQLDEWAEMSATRVSQRVIGLENCRRLFKWKVALRQAVQRGAAANQASLADLAASLGWSGEELQRRIGEASNFGSLYQEIREKLEGREGFAGTDIRAAIEELREFTHSLRHRAFGTIQAGSAPRGLTAGA